MATIFFMKFNESQGALIADEMAWHLSFKYGYRPARYADSIMNLLDDETARKNNFVAVYGGVGFPCFHFEVARKSKERLSGAMAMFGDLDKTGALVEDVYHDVHSRMINDKLRFDLGFDREELNQGKFEVNHRSIEIKQDAVRKEARKIMNYGDKQDCYHRIFDNEGILMGYDKENGIRAYHISHEGRSLDFAYPFDAIGTGKALGTRVFADVNYRMQLDERRRGFDFSDGLFLLLNSFVDSYDFNNKTGGYMQLFLIDATNSAIPQMTMEKADHGLFLSTEIIRAFRWGYIDRSRAQSMVERLILKEEGWEDMERELFETCSDSHSLRKHLMGYKPADVPRKPLN